LELTGRPLKTSQSDRLSQRADYDARIFAREKDWTASLRLIGWEHIKLWVNYQTGKLKGRKPTSAQLCKHRDGLYYLHIQLTDEAPEPIKSEKSD